MSFVKHKLEFNLEIENIIPQVMVVNVINDSLQQEIDALLEEVFNN